MQKTPRQLAKSYYQGELDRESYRRLRRDLIDELTESKMPELTGDDRGQLISERNTVPELRIEQMTPRSAGKTAVSHKFLMIGAVFLVVVMILVAFYVGG